MPGIQETRADNNISYIILQDAQEHGDLVRIVLTVSIQANDVVVMVLTCKFQAGLNGPTDAEVKRVTHDLRSGSLGPQPGLIGRTVIHY